MGGGSVMVGRVGGSVVGEWVGGLLEDYGWVVGGGTPSGTHPAADQSEVGLAVPLRRARASARRCAEDTSARR